MLVISVAILAVTVKLYDWVPKWFIPKQDTGVIYGSTLAPEGVTFADLTARQKAVADIVQNNANVEGLISTAGQGLGGVSGDNIGRMIIRLKPRGERKLSADALIQ